MALTNNDWLHVAHSLFFRKAGRNVCVCGMLETYAANRKHLNLQVLTRKGEGWFTSIAISGILEESTSVIRLVLIHFTHFEIHLPTTYDQGEQAG